MDHRYVFVWVQLSIKVGSFFGFWRKRKQASLFDPAPKYHARQDLHADARRTIGRGLISFETGPRSLLRVQPGWCVGTAVFAVSASWLVRLFGWDQRACAGRVSYDFFVDTTSTLFVPRCPSNLLLIFRYFIMDHRFSHAFFKTTVNRHLLDCFNLV